MTSANVKKCKHSEVTGILMHCDNEERMKRDHSNVHISKSRTHLNTTTFAGSGIGYRSAIQALNEIVEQLDALPGANKRKDRVEALSFDIILPKALQNAPDILKQEWFEEAHRVLVEVTLPSWGWLDPDKCWLCTSIHFDEVHEYLDPKTREWETSLEHMHDLFVPVVKTTNEEGAEIVKLNANVLNTKVNYRKLQKDLDEMTLNLFQVHYMDGTAKKSEGIVEELKAASYQALSEEVSKLEEQQRGLKQDNAQLKAEIEANKAKNVRLKENYDETWEEWKELMGDGTFTRNGEEHLGLGALEDLQANLEQQTQSLELEVKRLKINKEEEKEKHDDLERQNKKLEQTNTNLTAQITAQQIALDQLKKEEEERKDQVEELKKQRNALQKLVDSQFDKLRELVEQARDASGSLIDYIKLAIKDKNDQEFCEIIQTKDRSNMTPYDYCKCMVGINLEDRQNRGYMRTFLDGLVDAFEKRFNTGGYEKLLKHNQEQYERQMQAIDQRQEQYQAKVQNDELDFL